MSTIIEPDTLLTAPSAVAHAPIRRRPPILVATDGRDGSSSVLVTADRLTERLGAAPQALAVLEPFPTYGGEAPLMPTDALEAERAAATYATVCRRIVDAVGAAWPTQVAFGPPARTIARVAEERGAAFVVLGIGRHRLVDRLLGSEMALRVLRSGERPVLAVGPEADGVYRRAVVAVDFAPASARAAAIALHLLAPGSTLSLVHVRTRLELSQPLWDAWDAHASERAHEMLQRLAVALRNGTTGCDECGAHSAAPNAAPNTAPTAGRRDVTIGTATLVGDPAAEVLDYAERVGADLVAVGTHGPDLLERLLVGSTAADVVRLTSARLPGCSVLCCPPPAP
jgi:nucleotide-binding universal stress UspA family protein